MQENSRKTIHHASVSEVIQRAVHIFYFSCSLLVFLSRYDTLSLHHLFFVCLFVYFCLFVVVFLGGHQFWLHSVHTAFQLCCYCCCISSKIQFKWQFNWQKVRNFSDDSFWESLGYQGLQHLCNLSYLWDWPLSSMLLALCHTGINRTSVERKCSSVDTMTGYQ